MYRSDILRTFKGRCRCGCVNALRRTLITVRCAALCMHIGFFHDAVRTTDFPTVCGLSLRAFGKRMTAINADSACVGAFIRAIWTLLHQLTSFLWETTDLTARQLRRTPHRKRAYFTEFLFIRDLGFTSSLQSSVPWSSARTSASAEAMFVAKGTL